jgi:carbonic anhydrase/acetyltransferase-like protein (isoleucine patch superfamily)
MSLRPFLHRLRGVSVGRNVFIGDDVYLENEHPYAVEIQDGVHISLRAILLAHTRGPGKLIIEKDAFIGPCAVIATSGNRTLRIGEGAVIGAGVVIGKDVPARAFIPSPAGNPVANAMVPMTKAQTMGEFLVGLVPLDRKIVTPKSATVAAPAANRGTTNEESKVRG